MFEVGVGDSCSIGEDRRARPRSCAALSSSASSAADGAPQGAAAHPCPSTMESYHNRKRLLEEKYGKLIVVKPLNDAIGKNTMDVELPVKTRLLKT